MKAFRASPWVNYSLATASSSPSKNHDQLDSDHDEHTMDVDMDAPQISTLRQEESPPPAPPPPRNNKFRVKLLVKDNKGTSAQPPSVPKKHASDEDDELDEEDEEDQLIDDDDDDDNQPTLPRIVIPAPPPPTATIEPPPPKKKAPSKRKPRKSEKKIAEEERKAKEKAMQTQAGAPNLAPTMTWFEATPSEAYHHQDAGQTGSFDVGPPADGNLGVIPPEPSPSKAPAKKKAGPKKTAGPSKPRGKPGPKPKTPQTLMAQVLPLEDIATLSEGYTGTAASSPVAAYMDLENTPEPEPLPFNSAPLVEDTNMSIDNVPLPAYPLPTKPFPVQPPQKISAGFAPLIPLDRSGKKVRHWRTANREIRGIGGGRWFARSWVGDKESELATALAMNAAEKQPSSAATTGVVAIPKLSSVSISGGSSKAGRPKGSKNTNNTSLNASSAPSRAGSAVPSKMRNILLAPSSDGGDSDMMPPLAS